MTKNTVILTLLLYTVTVTVSTEENGGSLKPFTEFDFEFPSLDNREKKRTDTVEQSHPPVLTRYRDRSSHNFHFDEDFSDFESSFSSLPVKRFRKFSGERSDFSGKVKSHGNKFKNGSIIQYESEWPKSSSEKHFGDTFFEELGIKTTEVEPKRRAHSSNPKVADTTPNTRRITSWPPNSFDSSFYDSYDQLENDVAKGAAKEAPSLRRSQNTPEDRSHSFQSAPQYFDGEENDERKPHQDSFSDNFDFEDFVQTEFSKGFTEQLKDSNFKHDYFDDGHEFRDELGFKNDYEDKIPEDRSKPASYSNSGRNFNSRPIKREAKVSKRDDKPYEPPVYRPSGNFKVGDPYKNTQTDVKHDDLHHFGHEQDHHFDHGQDHHFDHGQDHPFDHGQDHHEQDHQFDHGEEHHFEQEQDHHFDHEQDHHFDHEQDHHFDHEQDHHFDHEQDHHFDHEQDHHFDHELGHHLDTEKNHHFDHEKDHHFDHSQDHHFDHGEDHHFDHGHHFDQGKDLHHKHQDSHHYEPDHLLKPQYAYKRTLLSKNDHHKTNVKSYKPHKSPQVHHKPKSFTPHHIKKLKPVYKNKNIKDKSFSDYHGGHFANDLFEPHYDYDSGFQGHLGPGKDDHIPGKTGVDYPTYNEVPHTSFSCKNVPHIPGMYANVEAHCQAYHVCHDDRYGEQGAGFLCTNGTLFNQATFSCDWWYNVDCGKALAYYSLNSDPKYNPYYQEPYKGPLNLPKHQHETGYHVLHHEKHHANDYDGHQAFDKHHESGFSLGKQHDSGFSLGKQHDSGFSLGKHHGDGFSLDKHHNGEFSLGKDHDSGFSLDKHHDGGFSLGKDHDSGFSLDKHHDGGFSFGKDHDSGFSLDKHGDRFSFDKIHDGGHQAFDKHHDHGFSFDKHQEGGFSFDKQIDLALTANPSFLSNRNDGFSHGKDFPLKNSGFSTLRRKDQVRRITIVPRNNMKILSKKNY